MNEKIEAGRTFTTIIDGVTYECRLYFQSYWGSFGLGVKLDISKIRTAKFLWWTYNESEWYYTYIIGFTDSKGDRPKYHFIGDVKFFNIEDAKNYVEKALEHREWEIKREVREREELKNTTHKNHI